jgi:hypothetical protein
MFTKNLLWSFKLFILSIQHHSSANFQQINVQALPLEFNTFCVRRAPSATEEKILHFRFFSSLLRDDFFVRAALIFVTKLDAMCWINFNNFPLDFSIWTRSSEN